MSHSASQSAIRVIQQEHACLSAVILGMLHFVREIDAGRKAPDLKVFRAMLLYISEYPEKIHHPKEDNFLFARLKQRTGKAAEVIARLEEDHAGGDERVRALEHALTRYELAGKEEFENFRKKVEDYAGAYLRHMRAEEDDVLPL
ncbi:hemerythrin domain-containing protein, partial [Noviherbaspirillum denitrificans]|uniref:hemerythrin domain-containing protein n=1 Tax=Noviherbaspirillum denitrificans TaxID=1968433 RepID=UPI00197DD4B6